MHECFVICIYFFRYTLLFAFISDSLLLITCYMIDCYNSSIETSENNNNFLKLIIFFITIILFPLKYIIEVDRFHKMKQNPILHFSEVFKVSNLKSIGDRKLTLANILWNFNSQSNLHFPYISFKPWMIFLSKIPFPFPEIHNRSNKLISDLENIFSR